MIPSCRALAALVLLVASTALANVEKVIFSGPEPVPIAQQRPTLSDLNLHTLTPDASTVRANLSRVFPGTDVSPLGHTSWLLLDNLTDGQRYEFRVCWAAIVAQEPTSFTLDVYDLETVWSTRTLIQSLAEYVSSRQAAHDGGQPKPPAGEVAAERRSSVLFLRVQAAADYFTDDRALMKDPPPVLVDLILDPYLYNVLPRSLLPTVGYLILLAPCTWFAARRIASMLQHVARPSVSETKKQR